MTSIVHWKDYNNKFKLCSDQYMIFVLTVYTIYSCFKIKNYVCLISLGLLFILYKISNYYKMNNNNLVDSNLWILTHSLVSISMIYIINKMKKYNEKQKINN